MCITILDAMRIQDYVFGGNRLQDNIDASELVEKVLNEWPIEVFQREVVCF